MTAMRGPRRWAVWSAACALGVTGLLLSGATAAQGQDPAQVCSDAHPNAGEADVPRYTQNLEGNWPMPIPGDPGGQVHLFYETVRGYNCAIAVSNGGATYLDVGIRTEGGTPVTDIQSSGTSTQPVLIHAPGVCVQVTAAVGERSVISGFTNCET
ncbi:hypothetical protein [Nocardiopsis ganjiahuensis]|uniref:hypothetical protein n=1 Tax=Nocardiopsis ganjiahuensis TaxID=239984 RepID=UPI000344E173|nr:hypothetical protein [Nocardiopsis ganjiahuensis]